MKEKLTLKRLFAAVMAILIFSTFTGFGMASNLNFFIRPQDNMGNIVSDKSQLYNEDEYATIEATSNDENRYYFSHWESQAGSSEGGVFEDPEDNSTTFTASHDALANNRPINIYAFFSTVRLEVSCDDDEHGTATASPRAPMVDDNVTLTATPKEGYRFKEWQVEEGYADIDDCENEEAHFTMYGGPDVLKIIAHFEAIEYSVTATAEPQNAGRVAVTSEHGVIGDVIGLSAESEGGYRFKEWQVVSGNVSIDDSSSASTYFTMGSENVEVKAIFEEIHAIAVTVEGEGTASASPDEQSNGNSVELFAEPSEGYEFDHWEVMYPDYISIDDPNSASTHFTMGSENVDIKAVFEAIQYNVTTMVDPEDSGHAIANPDTAAKNTIVELSATPNEGYRFNHWEVIEGEANIDDLQSATTHFTMQSGDVKVKAVFENTYNVTALVEGEGTVSVIPPSGPNGADIHIVATPGSGYVFDHWELISGNITIDDSRSASTSFAMGSENVVVKAVFEKIHNVSITVIPQNGGMAATNPTSGLTGDEISLTATPEQGYQFKEWRVVSGGITISDPFNAQTSFSLGENDVVIEAVFEAVYGVKTSVEGEGTAIAIPISGVQGTTVTLKATPNEGYQFREWEVVSGKAEIANPKSNITTFNLEDENVEVKAVFDEIVITDISLDSENAKKSYIVGDMLDVEGLVLEVTKSDGSTERINVTEDMVSGFDSSKIGKQTLAVTYGDHIGTYDIEVKEPEKENNGEHQQNYYKDTDMNSSSNRTPGSDATKSSPNTGDHRHIAPWFALMTVSAAGFVYTYIWQRKRRTI